MVTSVAEYAKDNRVREAVRRSDNIRLRTLEKCYSVPGYADLPRKVRNKVYDNIKLMIEKEGEPPQDVDNNKRRKEKCII